MRYRAQLRPSLFIFTGRVTRQQIVFFISLFISSSNSPPSIPLANQPLLISLRRVFERANSARVVHFALAWNGRRSNSLLRSKRTMRPAKLHARSSTAIRYLDGGLRLSRAELARRKNREQLAFNYRDAASQKFNQSSRDALK